MTKPGPQDMGQGAGHTSRRSGGQLGGGVSLVYRSPSAGYNAGRARLGPNGLAGAPTSRSPESSREPPHVGNEAPSDGRRLKPRSRQQLVQPTRHLSRTVPPCCPGPFKAKFVLVTTMGHHQRGSIPRWTRPTNTLGSSLAAPHRNSNRARCH